MLVLEKPIVALCSDIQVGHLLRAYWERVYSSVAIFLAGNAGIGAETATAGLSARSNHSWLRRERACDY